MAEFSGNRSEGLGQAVGKGTYATPLAKETEPHLTRPIVEGVKLAGNVALAGAAVGVGLASIVILEGPGEIIDLAKSGMRKVKSRVLGSIPHDIDAGKYLDAPGGQIDESQRA